ENGDVTTSHRVDPEIRRPQPEVYICSLRKARIKVMVSVWRGDLVLDPVSGQTQKSGLRGGGGHLKAMSILVPDLQLPGKCDVDMLLLTRLKHIEELGNASLHFWPVPIGAHARLLNLSENMTYLVTA